MVIIAELFFFKVPVLIHRKTVVASRKSLLTSQHHSRKKIEQRWCLKPDMFITTFDMTVLIQKYRERKQQNLKAQLKTHMTGCCYFS